MLPEEAIMDVDFIVTVYVTIDEICQHVLAEPKYRPKMTPAEILLVAIVAARYFNNNLERALLVLGQTGYIPENRRLSISRYNRQLHLHLDTLEVCVNTLLELSRHGEAFILDSMPVPVCKRKRARRCRKVQGRMFCGYCATKDEKFFGWRLHLICNPGGLPVNFVILPAALHDLTPIYELSYELPNGSTYNDPQKLDHMLRRNICAKMSMWRQYEQQETGQKKCGIQVPSSAGGSQGAENIE